MRNCSKIKSLIEPLRYVRKGNKAPLFQIRSGTQTSRNAFFSNAFDRVDRFFGRYSTIPESFVFFNNSW